MAPPQRPVAPAKKKTNTTPIIIGVVALVVVIAAVVAIIAATAGGGKDYFEGKEVREFQGVTVTGEELASYPDGAADPAIGLDAPALEGAFFDGTPVSVTPGDGTPYMLVFLAHWCPHCNAEVPRLVEWYEEGGVPEGLEVVGITTGSDQKNPNWPPSDWLMNDMKWPEAWPVIADSPQRVAAEAYGLSGYPFMVIIDEEGKVVLRTSGEKGKEVIDQMVDDALGISGNAPSVTDGVSSTEAP